ncbi:MAG: hypothetical protein O3C40_21115 [Planctomycetota bacterium]|nr:hypothetical protein [Planctomycetota bacterium]
MMRTVTAMAFLACCGLLGVVHADDNENSAPAKSDERSAKTIVYAARNAPADVLSRTLAEFLEETGGRVVSDPTSNVLLIQTAAENQERVIAVLQQLDRAPHTLRIQMHLLKARGESLAEFDTASLSGRTDEVIKSITTLASMEGVYVANRIELTAIENQKALLQVGETVPLAVGTVFAPGSRGISNNYQNLDVGIMFSVEARVSGDSDIVTVVDFEKSGVEQRNVGTDEESKSVPQGVSRLTHRTTSRIRDGHSLLVGTLVSQSPDGVGEAYLVLSASIDASEHPQQVATLHSSSPKPASRTDSGQATPASDAKRIDPRYLAYYAKLLAKYDQNGDQGLDADERSKMSKDCSDADTDKNGLVTVEELTIWSIKR